MDFSAAPDPTPAPIYTPAGLTHSAESWLAQAPDEAEQARIEQAARSVREQRRVAIAFYKDPAAARHYSLELFREPVFAPLHLAPRLISRIIAKHGEPPVVETVDDPAFAQYLRRAVQTIASARVRRDLGAQLRRFLPQFVEQERWKDAVAIDNNAFRTTFGNEVSPFLVEMAFGGLLRWYETHEPEASSDA